MKAVHCHRIFATLAVLAGLAGTATAQQGTLLLANRSGGSVSLLDVELGLEMARLPIGPRVPHEVAVSPDGRWALSSEFGGDSNPGRRLMVIDVPAAAVAGYIDLGDPSRSHSFVFLPDGRRAVATMERAHGLGLVDVQDRTLLRTYSLGGPREGHMVRVSPDGSRAYVTARTPEDNTGTLSVVFLNEDRPPVLVDTGDYSEGLAVSPDGREVWVANRYGGTIEVVDTEALAIVATIETGSYPTRMEFTGDGRVAVVSGLSSREGPGSLTLYDRAGRRPVFSHKLRDFPVPPGAGPGGILGVAVGGGRIFVDDQNAGRVTVFDLADLGAPPRVLTDGHDYPDGIAWSPLRLSVFAD